MAGPASAGCCAVGQAVSSFDTHAALSPALRMGRMVLRVQKEYLHNCTRFSAQKAIVPKAHVKMRKKSRFRA
jgi:hypothetical protein